MCYSRPRDSETNRHDRDRVKVTRNHSNDVAAALPVELQLVPARVVRQYVPETSLWRLERSGDLPAVRIGRRRYYRLSDWEKFLNRCAQRGPLPVPWARQNQAAC